MATKQKDAKQKETVTIGGREFRGRTPQEWSAAESDEALRLGFVFRGIITGVGDEADEKAATEALFASAEKLVTESKHRRAMTIGLWPADTEYSREAVKDVEAFFNDTPLTFNEMLGGTAKAITSFFGSPAN